jgi:hypothetical protein
VKKFTQALSAIALALLPAYVLSQGGISYSTGSGSGGITSGTTVVTGCGSGTVIFNLAGVASCDTDLVFSGDTLTATKILSTSLISKSTGSGTPTYFEIPTLTLATGISNSCLGNGTCAALTSGARNTVYGSGAGTTIAGTNDNTVVGNIAASGSAIGARNTFIGANAGPNVNNTGTSDNTAVGYNSCGNVTSGSSNTCIGSSSGQSISTSTSQTMLGANTQGGSGLAYSIALGDGGNVSASNQMGVGGNGKEVTDYYWSEGALPNASPATSVTHQSTPASGTDIAGTAYITAGGKATGTGAGGDRIEKTSPALTTGTTLQTLETRSLIRAKQFTLTDNTATTFAVQALGNDTGGGGTIHYCIYAADATTAGLECGSVDFAGVDVTSGAGGEVCSNPTKVGTPLQALSGSTLTVTFAATTGTDLCNIRVTADTDIVTPVSLWIKYHVINSGRTITPQ